MMDCNWMVRDTEEKRQELIAEARVMYADDLESQVIRIASLSAANRVNICNQWKKLQERKNDR